MLEIIHQSLVEAGKNKQKAISMLFLLSFTVIVIQIFLTTGSEVQVLSSQLKLPRDKAAAIYFVIYSVFFFRFVVITNYEKIIFFHLYKELKKEGKHKEAWLYVHPSAVNYMLYEWHIKNGINQKINLVFIKLLSVVIVFFPPVYTLSNLTFNHFGELSFLSLITIAFGFYMVATKNLVSSISEIRDMNKAFTE